MNARPISTSLWCAPHCAPLADCDCEFQGVGIHPTARRWIENARAERRQREQEEASRWAEVAQAQERRAATWNDPGDDWADYHGGNTHIPVGWIVAAGIVCAAMAGFLFWVSNGGVV